ncbi:MAG: type II secretion system protein M [Thiotrichales bacterium]|nr:MAG: type II secretion system protein M [Thiotrichales bacterium]
MKQLEDIQNWYHGLQQRERQLVLAASVVVIVTIFYLVVWEPIINGVSDQTQKYQSQMDILEWMQGAATEVRSLKATGASKRRSNSNQPVSLLVEQSASTAGLKPYVTKLESTSDKGARVTIDAASFDQILLWLNTLQTRYGISVSSANLDRDDKPGAVNARITLGRD